MNNPITGFITYITRLDSLRSALSGKLRFFFQRKNIKKIIKWLVTLFFLASIFVFILGIFGRIGSFPQNSLFWEKISIDKAKVTKFGIGNFGYISEGDINCSASQGPSPCEVLENGISLPGERNALHDSIGNNGRGTTSFWYESVIFSSSDNSDVITNGRYYEFRKPRFLFSQIQMTLIAILAYGLYALLRRMNQSNQQITSLPSPVAFYKTDSLLLWILPFILYFIVLAIPIPIYLLKDTEIIYFIIAGIILIRSMGKDDNKNRIISFTVITLMVGISLASIWSMATPRYHVVGGLLPWSDTMGYYTDAFQMSAGNKVSYSVIYNRILHTAPLAALFGAISGSLRISLGIIGLFWAAVIYALSREMELSFGNKSGVICALLSISFYSSFIAGTLLSENSGFLLGGIGVSALLNGARREHFLSVMIGILFLSLGLNARNGAYFVLPALVLWASFAFTSRFSFQKFALSVGAVLGGFGINALLSNIFAASSSVASSSYTGIMLPLFMWGWVTNHNPSDIFTVYPGIKFEEIGQVVTPLILPAIQSNPLQALAGIFKPFTDVFLNNGPLLFGFINNLNGFNVFSKIIYALFMIGCIVCLFHYRKPVFSLLAAACLGIFASVPLTYFVGYRGVATTAPFTFCIVGASLAFLNSKLLGSSNTSSEEIKKSNHNFGLNLPAYLALFVLIGILAGPIMVSTLKPNEWKSPELQCVEGVPLSVPPIRNSYIRLSTGNANLPPKLPDVNIFAFFNSKPGWDGPPGWSKAVSELEAGTILYAVPTSTYTFIMLPNEFSVNEDNPSEMCLTEFNSGILFQVTSYKSTSDYNLGRRLLYWGGMIGVYGCAVLMFISLTRRNGSVLRGIRSKIGKSSGNN